MIGLVAAAELAVDAVERRGAHRQVTGDPAVYRRPAAPSQPLGNVFFSNNQPAEWLAHCIPTVYLAVRIAIC